MLTFTQTDWGDDTTVAGDALETNFSGLYGIMLVVGGNVTATFTSAAGVFNYLPAAGPAGALSSNTVNPQTTSAGELGGEVLALTLNTDLSSALGNDADFGSLRICNFTDVPSLDGQTVDQFLATANMILGGGSGPFSPSVATAVARRLNNAFVNSAPSTFAQQSLVAGACP